MSSRLLSAALCVLLFFTLQPPRVCAQTNDRVRETWKGPDLALIRSILKEGGTSKPSTGAAGGRHGALKFTPAGDSGVADSLAGAFGSNDAERAALKQAFEQIKQGYEAEVAKEGRSNNLAAAMTFFIAVNVSAFHRAELPSDAATANLFNSLAGTLSNAPEFARLSNAEKQQMHDWLVTMGGFVMTGYVDAKQNKDEEGLKSFSELADYSMRLVLGVEVGKMSFAGNNLSVEGAGDAPPAANTNGNQLVGAWSLSASSPAGSNLVTNAGYFKGQYQFKADGTYTFKSERWFGYTRSKEFYTTEESGTYTISGDTLTVSPKTSRTILRNPEGVVQRTQNNQLEKVTYSWRLHHFEGINETQLVLQSPKETARDGGFSQSSVFPNSYLYSPGASLEWRY